MDNRVYIEIAPGDVNYVNRIMEGYEYLGILTTIDPRRATCCINATADTRKEVVEILTHLDTEVKILADREEAEAGLREIFLLEYDKINVEIKDGRNLYGSGGKNC